LCKDAGEARLSKSLVRLKNDAELGMNLKSFRYKTF